ncbi:hypothetical protein Cni_G29433 [Canna indica]|uniref:Uncharacterized protein n=1 Tax=Canna indica TaxID=4628 RepID=A0AAQ3L4R9_9LILI|nr:hypothetical protein Cni_G29433 [Canna indica]
MAKDAIGSYGTLKDLNTGRNNAKDKVSLYEYQSPWMTQWKQENSVGGSLSYASRKQHYAEELEHMQVENTGFNKVQFITIGTSKGSAAKCRNEYSSDHNAQGLALRLHEPTELMGPQKVTINMGNSAVLKDVDRFDEAALSDEVYLYKHHDSIYWENRATCHSPNSEDISLDKNHFPLYEINPKMESIINAKSGPQYVQEISRQVEVQQPQRGRTLNSDVIKFAAKGLHFPSRMTKTSAQVIEHLKPVKGSKYFQHELSALSYKLATRKFAGSRPNMGNIHITDEKISSISNHKHEENLIKASHSTLKHDICNFLDPSDVAHSEVKAEVKCASTRDIRDSWAENSPLPALTRENNKLLVRGLSNKISNCLIHNAGNLVMHNMNPVNDSNLRSQYPSNVLDCRLTRKSTCMELSRREQSILDSKDPASTKGIALFEMLTVPATSRCHRNVGGDSQPLTNSSSMEDGVNVTHTTGTRKRSSVQIATIDIDACQTRTSPEGMISDGLQKDLICPNLNLYYKSISPNKQTVGEHATFSDKTCSTSDMELNTSRTESLIALQVASHIPSSDVQNCNDMVENPAQAKHFDQWLKRLRPRPSDACGLDYKRLKIGDDTASTEICSFLTAKHKAFIFDMTECTEEQQITNRGRCLSSTPECSCELSSKEAQYWIQRWCRKNPQKAKAQANVATPWICHPENLKVIPEDVDGKQFPSIRAMALMGRAIKNYQTCGFHQKGSSTVWNTENI